MRDIRRDRTAVRLALCVFLAIAAGHYGYTQAIRRLATGVAPDFGQVWFGARAVLHGQNPYALIGPGRAFEWEAPCFYPFPAFLVALPLAFFDQTVATGIFLGVGMFGLVWALTQHGYGPLLALGSTCVLNALEIGQWSPLLSGAVVLAPLGLFLAAKPTVGAAIFAANPTRWTILGGAGLVLLSFAIQPNWLRWWWESLHAASIGDGTPYPYTAAIAFPAGPLALLALLRWRRPEARLVAALACVPLTTIPYEAVYLFLVPRGWRESLVLTVSSWGMIWYVVHVFPLHGLQSSLDAYGHAMVPFLYLPATIMVLRRPNEGAVRSVSGMYRALRHGPHRQPAEEPEHAL